MLKLLVLCIINAEIEAIISNYYFRPMNKNINFPTLDKFIFRTFDRIQKIFAFFLLFLLNIVEKLKTFALFKVKLQQISNVMLDLALKTCQNMILR